MKRHHCLIAGKPWCNHRGSKHYQGIAIFNVMHLESYMIEKDIWAHDLCARCFNDPVAAAKSRAVPPVPAIRPGQ